MYFRLERIIDNFTRIDKKININSEELSKYPDKYIKIENEEDAKTIQDALELGKEVIIRDNKWEIKDFKRKYGISAKDRNKMRILNKAEEYYKARVNKGSLLDYLYYIDINNELNSKGFFITDSNKEEKFLEILETGDDRLIDLLEEFLILKDQLSALKNARQIFVGIVEKLKETSEDDIEYLQELEDSIPE
jgi:predicted transcriptional regulator